MDDIKNMLLGEQKEEKLGEGIRRKFGFKNLIVWLIIIFFFKMCGASFSRSSSKIRAGNRSSDTGGHSEYELDIELLLKEIFPIFLSLTVIFGILFISVRLGYIKDTKDLLTDLNTKKIVILIVISLLFLWLILSMLRLYIEYKKMTDEEFEARWAKYILMAGPLTKDQLVRRSRIAASRPQSARARQLELLSLREAAAQSSSASSIAHMRKLKRVEDTVDGAGKGSESTAKDAGLYAAQHPDDAIVPGVLPLNPEQVAVGEERAAAADLQPGIMHQDESYMASPKIGYLDRLLNLISR